MLKAKMNNFSCWVEETDSDTLMDYFGKMLVDSGFNVLDIAVHYFRPQGFTALFLLSESHFAIHTFPERNKTYLELTSCVEVPYYNFVQNMNLQRTRED